MKRVLYTMLCLSTCICNVYSEDTHSSKNVRSSDGRISIGVYVEVGQFEYTLKTQDEEDKKDGKVDTTKRHAIGGCGGLCVGYVYYTGKMRLYGEVKCGMGFSGKVNSQDGRGKNILKRGINIGGAIGCGYQPNNSNWYVGGLCYIGWEGCRYLSEEESEVGDEEHRQQGRTNEKSKLKWKTKGVVHFMPCLEIGYDNRNVNVGLYFGCTINAGNKKKFDDDGDTTVWKINHGFCGCIKLSVLI